MTTPKPASAPQADKWKALEANLAERYLVCSDAAATPSSILLAVLNAVAEVNDASAQVREAEPLQSCTFGHPADWPCDICKPAAEPLPVAQGDGSVLAFVRVMRNLRERYPADADVVEAYSNILQAAIIKQAEARTALEASLAACRALLAEAVGWNWLDEDLPPEELCDRVNKMLRQGAT